MATKEDMTTRQLALMSFDDIGKTGMLHDAAEVAPSEFDEDERDVVDKHTLIGVPFIIQNYKFVDGKGMGSYVVVRAVTKDNKQVVFTDGSAGIYKQLADAEGNGFVAGILCRHGLRVSKYTYKDKNGNEQPAETFYLDTRKK